MINRPWRNDSRAEWLIEKQMRARWLIKAQATLERSLQNIRSPDEWEEDFLKDNAGSSPLRARGAFEHAPGEDTPTIS
jgi:hypothetical protein